MKFISKSQAITIKNSDSCTVTEYLLNDETMDFAVAKVTGRYPDTAYATNQQCKEMVYIHEGHGKLGVGDQEHPLKPGDLVLIEPGEKFYWEGHLTLFISCRPAWSASQHQIID